MDRREAIKTAGGAAFAAATALGTGLAFAAGADEHAGHAGHKGMQFKNFNEELVASSSRCSKLAEQCIKISYDALEANDKSMAACGRLLQQLVAACAALQTVAIYNSKHLKATAKLVKDICEESEKECLKHKEHQQCVDCATACKECADLCSKVA